MILGVCSVQSNQEVAHKSVTATGLPAFAQNSSNPGENIKDVDSLVVLREKSKNPSHGIRPLMVYAPFPP